MHHHGAINPLSVLFVGSDLLQGTVQSSMAVDAVVAPVVIVMRSKNSPFFNFVTSQLLIINMNLSTGVVLSVSLRVQPVQCFALYFRRRGSYVSLKGQCRYRLPVVCSHLSVFI